MDYENFPAINYVRGLQTKGSRYGLERTRKLLDLLSSPDDKLKIIHVAGTNGKGSVCSYITNILLAAGKKTGTFTSPAVYSYEEQFAIDGKPDLALTEKYLEQTLLAAKGLDDSPTAFELETCAALAMFAGEGCEYAAVECGLGGLSDSTNAINKKCVAVINSISLEHTALLGHTIGAIAKQKAGIIKNCPAVINALQQPEVLRYFEDIGGVIAETPQILTDDVNGCVFTVGGKKYSVKMHGKEQAYNAAAAIKACEILGVDGGAIKNGLENAILGGRVEVIPRQKTYILDGAHNPASFAPLVSFLKANFGSEKLTIIYGCLSDKDTDGCVRLLSELNGEVIVVTPVSYRAKQAAEVYTICKKYFNSVRLADGVPQALDLANGEAVVVCGSFTLLKEAKEWIGKRQ
ncbi:MAG: hypothetical protein LUD27_07810 [Clostridia bacterium]|nr:hypothetical protein [Clostridia bacterium]